MALKDILAISGKSGLFKFLSQGRNGIIVESLNDGKKIHIPSTAKISALEDIAIYTETEEKPLAEVFRIIREKESSGPAISAKADNESLKKYLEEVVPDYEKDRVYVSDIKKLLQWYNTLQELNMLDLLDEQPEEEEKKEETPETSESAETEKE